MSAEVQRRAWNRACAAYQQRHRIGASVVHYGPITPDEGELALLGDVRGQRILEIGCGGGQNCLVLARQGATVVGIDVSDEQIAFANQLLDDTGLAVEFERADATALDFLPAASFDLILAVYVFPYIEDLAAALAECARLLRSGGRLIISQDHPIRACYWDAENEDEGVLPARSYFEETPLKWTFTGTTTSMRTYQRTLSQWIHSLHQAHFAIRHLWEFPLPPDLADDPWADEYTKEIAVYLPQTMVVEGVMSNE
jgi:SAM-dependent methyltransferase